MKAGIIGCGIISSSYLRLAKLFKDLEFVAVADLNMEAANLRADEFKVKALSVKELLSSDEIEIIVNLTIPDVHFEVTRDILNVGKHAYSEKPFVLSVAEGEELKELANRKNLRVGSTPDTFLGGSHQYARKIIDEGKIGKILSGTCFVMSHGMEHWHPNPDFFFQPGAGPILDIGPYYITNLVQILGPVKAVSAMSTTGFSERTISNGPRNGEKIKVTTPTNIHSLLEFENGALITIGASWDVWKHKHNNMELYGTLGSIIIPDPNFFGGEISLSNADKDFDKVELWDHPFAINNETHGDFKFANYRCAGLADMIRSIKDNKPHKCNLELALHVVDVMLSILKSGEERKWIKTSTSCERPSILSDKEAIDLLI